MPRFDLKRLRPHLASILFITLVGLIVAAPTLAGRSLPLDLSALPPTGQLDATVALDSETLDYYGRTHASSVYPGYAFIAQTAATNQSVLWNPYEYMGTPFMAAWKTRCFSPFTIPFYLFSLPMALGLSILLKSCVAGFCAYYATRKLGYTQWFSLVCAFTFQLGYGLVSQPLDPLSDALPWVPLLFLFSERAYLKQLRYWPTGAITLALMLLSGDSIATLCTLAVFLIYALVNQFMYPHQKGYAVTILTFAVASFFAIGLAAVQLIPYLDYLRDTVAVNPETKQLPLLFNIPLLFLGNFVGPRHFAFLHVGIIQVLTTLLWLAMRPSLYRHHRIKIDALQFTSIGLVTITLLYGHLASNTSFAALLSHHQLLMPWGFMMALSTVITLSIWLELTPEQCQTIMRTGLIRSAIALVVALVALWFLYPDFDWNTGDQRTILIAIALCIGFFVMLAYTLFRPRTPLLAMFLIILITIDLTYTNTTNAYRSPIPATRASTTDDTQPLRIAGQLSHPQSILLHHRIAQNRGTVGRPLKHVYRFLQEAETRPELTTLTPANQLLFSMEHLQPMPASERQSMELESITDAGLARYRLLEHTPELQLAYNTRAKADTSLSDLDPTRAPLIRTDQGLPSSNTPTLPLSWVVLPTTTALTINVVPQSDAILIINRVLGSGWEATIDGEPAELLAVNELFSGLHLTSENRVVELRYAPSSLKIGRALSALTAILIALGYLNLVYHRHKQKSLLP
ncbi:MAG: hypothetical protein VCD00_02285 [Candidatus Hydrogenedentota bacterium]